MCFCFVEKPPFFPFEAGILFVCLKIIKSVRLKSLFLHTFTSR